MKDYPFYITSAEAVVQKQYLLTYRDELFGPISSVIPHEDGILEFVCGDESYVCHKADEVRVVGKPN